MVAVLDPSVVPEVDDAVREMESLGSRLTHSSVDLALILFKENLPLSKKESTSLSKCTQTLEFSFIRLLIMTTFHFNKVYSFSLKRQEI